MAQYVQNVKIKQLFYNIPPPTMLLIIEMFIQMILIWKYLGLYIERGGSVIKLRKIQDLISVAGYSKVFRGFP
mgnify:CR=1 FL=1